MLQRRLGPWRKHTLARAAAAVSGTLPPPIAAQRPHKVLFGAVPGEDCQNRGNAPMPQPIARTDPWFWLRDDERENEEVLNHLRTENAYTEQQTVHLQGVREEIYNEHISHLKETDEGPSHPHGPWSYYTRTVKGLSYKLHCRRPRESADSSSPIAGDQEQILLDENEVGAGKSQCVVTGVKPSPSHSRLAYAVDFTGDETYTVAFKDLLSGSMLQDQLEGVCGGVQWGKDDTTVFYVTEDDAKRPWKLWRHKIGEAQIIDKCLYTEEDELFYFSIGKTTSGRFIVAASTSSETHEMRVLDLSSVDGNDAPLITIQVRQFGLRYEVEHIGELFLVWANKDNAVNNRLMRVSVDAVLSSKGGQSAWEEVLPYNPSMRIESVTALRDYVAIEGREEGLTRIWAMDGSLDSRTLRRIEFDEELYEVEIGTNKEHDSPLLRISYSSLTTPRTEYDCDLRTTSTKDLLQVAWQQEVPSFDPAKYVCRRFFATAPDGVQIPISMVHRKDLYDEDGDRRLPKPCLLYGYGSYGICVDPGFDVHILPYLDRGMVYCIANVRGGGEMGRQWYEEQGKYLTKRNTFSDFISCAEHLVEQGITTPDKLAIEGRSAGGLLMGAVMNMRPDLFRIVVAGVPFVDVMNSMSDPSIPLTTGEWEEWGNPNEWKYFDYMLSYSPYDNVRELPYPDVFITAGLHDPRVAYWESAKWASKLRANNTSPSSEVLLKMDLEVGHFSASDRYRYKKEKAFEQAFVLDKLGIASAGSR